MIELELANRKSPVLTPSALACLRHIATINLTAGCAHDCLYCYIRGYRNYPGERHVTLYADTVPRLAGELCRKRSAVPAVYFSPSSDLFQPVPQLLELAYEVLKLLFEAGIRVAFLTKGVIPKQHMRLLADHAPLVFAEIGLISLDDSVLRLFEPAAARADRRLAQVAELVQHGITTEVRVDPIIPGFTDDIPSLRGLISAVAARGVKTVAASTLFLRPAIVASLRRNLSSDQFARVMAAFTPSQNIGIDATGRSSVQAVPLIARQQLYDRLRAIAVEFGIDVKICACKNPDFAQVPCGIAGRWQLAPTIRLPSLFSG